MAVLRPEPYHMAVATLRDRLREGMLRPGARITVSEIADDLQLSATPVREALSRLVGEGVLEDRRGQGFFVRALTGVDIADLFRLNLAQLSIAHDPHRSVLSGRPERPLVEVSLSDSVRDVELLFRDWIGESGSRALEGSHRTLETQLGPVRRVEHMLISDLDAEAAELRGLDTGDPTVARLPLLRRFHARRVALADRLAVLIHRGREGPEK